MYQGMKKGERWTILDYLFLPSYSCGIDGLQNLKTFILRQSYYIITELKDLVKANNDVQNTLL